MREFKQVPTKILRITIWLNGLVSVLLALSILAVWIISAFNLHNLPDPRLFRALSVFIAACTIGMPVIGVCMLLMFIRREARQAPSKILHITIWLNGSVSVLLILMLISIRVIASYLHNPHLILSVTQFAILFLILLPILGISMLVMEILSRRDRSRSSAGGDAQAESS